MMVEGEEGGEVVGGDVEGWFEEGDDGEGVVGGGGGVGEVVQGGREG